MDGSGSVRGNQKSDLIAHALRRKRFDPPGFLQKTLYPSAGYADMSKPRVVGLVGLVRVFRLMLFDLFLRIFFDLGGIVPPQR
jgi:hypothetical protein